MTAAPMRLMAVLTVVFALAATAAEASASEFTFSKTGALAGAQVASQQFTTTIGSFECAKDKLSGSATQLKTTVQKLTVQFEKCVYFGVTLKATPAELELNTNGNVNILKAFQLEGTSCNMRFPAQSLAGAKYTNRAGKLEVSLALNGLKSSGTGALCTHPESNGAFAGSSLAELAGGTIEVI